MLKIKRDKRHELDFIVSAYKVMLCYNGLNYKGLYGKPTDLFFKNSRNCCCLTIKLTSSVSLLYSLSFASFSGRFKAISAI